MKWLNKISWYYKILAVVVGSLISTTLPLPPPFNFADISFIAALEAYNNILWYGIVIIVITITDTTFAIFTYHYSHKLIPFFIRSDKRKKQLENIRQILLHGKRKEKKDPFNFLLPFNLEYYSYGIFKVFNKIKLPLKKYGSDIYLLLACATPLPYTATIYAAAILEYNKTKFVIINLIGRFIKYFVMGIAFYFGFKFTN